MSQTRFKCYPVSPLALFWEFTAKRAMHNANLPRKTRKGAKKCKQAILP